MLPIEVASTHYHSLTEIVKIYPSILKLNITDFQTQFLRVLPFFTYFQIDIADGQYVPTRTVQIEEILLVLQKQQPLIHNISFEFHLMVKDWQKEIEKLDASGDEINLSRIFIPVQEISNSTRSFVHDKKLGVFLNPEDTIEDYWGIIKNSPVTQIMTVEPGLQGQPFMPYTLNKIDQLRQKGYTREIVLDGGINDQTISLICARQNVPDAVCPGSYFSESVEERLALLRQKIGE